MKYSEFFYKICSAVRLPKGALGTRRRFPIEPRKNLVKVIKASADFKMPQRQSKTAERCTQEPQYFPRWPQDGAPEELRGSSGEHQKTPAEPEAASGKPQEKFGNPKRTSREPQEILRNPREGLGRLKT